MAGFISKHARCFCFIMISVLIAQLILFNFAILYGFWMINDALSGKIMQKFSASKLYTNFIENGKNGGFTYLLQQTLERIYLVSYPENQTSLLNGRQVSFFGFDVSHSGEAMYVYRRIIARQTFPYKKLVVDIGANDGILSSNSYNFIQLGWDAILVEPQSSQMNLAKQNLKRYIHPHSEHGQKVDFVQAVLGMKNDMVDFVIKPDLVSMESHVYNENSTNFDTSSMTMIKVQSLTVKTFTEKYKIPKHFGVLSIDAEGSSFQILHQWLKLGYRPAYIICETLRERRRDNINMFDYDYILLGKRGWNLLYEHSHQKSYDLFS